MLNRHLCILCFLGSFLAPLLQPAEVIGVCLSECVRVVKRFPNRYSSYSSSLILTKLGTHDLHANMQNDEQINKILILKFWANFFKTFDVRTVYNFLFLRYLFKLSFSSL